MIDILYIASRAVHFTALFLLFGITLFACLLATTQARFLLERLDKVVQCSVWLTAFSAVAILALQSGQMGDGWQDVFNVANWYLVLGTAFGQVWRWHLLLTLGTIVLFMLPKTYRERGWLLLSALLLLTLGWVGHTTILGGIPGVLHRINHGIHLLCAGYWLGGLLPFLVCLHALRQPEIRAMVVQALIRFSVAGHWFVAVLILSGFINLGLILPVLTLDLTSNYQFWMLLKIILVLLMVMLACINRYFLLPRMANKPEQTQRQLIQSAVVEFTLGVITIVIISGSALLSPN